jgi:hypothetical protein
MAVNLVSPGVKIREIDLTLGRIDQTNDQVAAFVGPFQKGPVDLPVLIQNEQQLRSVFGDPKLTDGQNEYWLTASNYLSYGGIMRIVRADSNTNKAMGNAYIPVGIGSTGGVKIKSVQDYNGKTGQLLDNTLNNFTFAAKNPGTWGNALTVYTIDAAADQIISGINTTETTVTTQIFDVTTTKTGTAVSTAPGQITGITTDIAMIGKYVQVPGDYSSLTGLSSVTSLGIGTVYVTPPFTFTDGETEYNGTFRFGTVSTTSSTTGVNIVVGQGVSVPINQSTPTVFNGYLKGIITGIGNSSIDVKLISRHDTTNSTSTYIEYAPKKQLASIPEGSTINIIGSNASTIASYSPTSNYKLLDWYDQQTLILGTSSVNWKNIAGRPSTSEYTLSKGGRNDEINIVVVDNKGTLSGNVGEILEKFEKLSKATDGKVASSQSIYYKDYIRDNSSYLFVGAATSGASTKFADIDSYSTYTGGDWQTDSSDTFFEVTGNKEYALNYGSDYSASGVESYDLSESSITEKYSIFENPAEYSINYILGGPAKGDNIFEAQAKASQLVAIANQRKDCMAVVSAYQTGVLNSMNNSAQQTENIVEFFNGVNGSTYAVFDAGYKYTYDRYNKQFLYLACNSDVAGLMARTSINQYPWFSPAGASRGVLNNAIRLAYNPTESQRDELYSNGINPIIASPGQGIILYGDKTASSYISAFDRINVRRLFLTIERTIEQAARSQLFEFNDAITRTNFINLVDPYLRDIRVKRGITDYLLVCDESNNTPDIIDSNQFRADIFIQPARSINFINITFVATRTGISFSEVVGNI